MSHSNGSRSIPVAGLVNIRRSLPLKAMEITISSPLLAVSASLSICLSTKSILVNGSRTRTQPVLRQLAICSLMIPDQSVRASCTKVGTILYVRVINTRITDCTSV